MLAYWTTLSAQADISGQVFQKEGRLYCDSDYKRNFVPRCAQCSEFIMQVSTLEKPIKANEA